MSQAINVNSGGTIGAGIPVAPNTTVTTAQTGTLTSDNGVSTLAQGSTYAWKLSSFAAADNGPIGVGSSTSASVGAVAAAGTSWDLLNFQGLMIDQCPWNDPGQQHHDRRCRDAASAIGQTDTYVFPIAESATPITYNASAFMLEVNGVATPLAGGPWGIQLDQANPDQIDLTYSAVPEPMSLGLVALRRAGPAQAALAPPQGRLNSGARPTAACRVRDSFGDGRESGTGEYSLSKRVGPGSKRPLTP